MAKNKADSDGMATTVKDAWQRVLTSMSAYIGEANKAHGVTATMASGLKTVAENFDLLASAAGVLAVASLARFILQVGVSTVSLTTNTAARLRSIASEVAAARAQVASTATTLALARSQAVLSGSLTQVTVAEAAYTAATVRSAAARTAAMALIGGIPGLIATVITVVAAAAASFFLFGDSLAKVKSELGDLKTPLEDVKQRFAEMGKATQLLNLQQIKDELKTVEQSYAETVWNIKLAALSERSSIFSPPTEEVKVALKIIEDASRQTAAGMRVDWTAASAALNETAGVSDKLKLKFLTMISAAEASGVSADGLRSRIEALSAAMRGNTAAAGDNAAALSAVADKKAALEAKENLAKMQEGLLTKAELEKAALAKHREYVEAIKKVDKDSALISAAQIAQDEARIKDKYTDKTPKARQNPVENAYLQKRQALTISLAEAQNKLKNAQAGVFEADEKELTKLEAWLAVGKNTVGMNKGQVAVLTDLAKSFDAASKATKTLADERARSERITQGLAEVETTLLEAQGRHAEAVQTKILETRRKLKDDAQKAERFDVVTQIEIVETFEINAAKLDEVQAAIEKLNAARLRDEQLLSAQVDAGLVTELDQRTRLLEIHQATYEALQKIRPELEALSALPGVVGEKAAAALSQMDTQMVQLKATTDRLSETLSSSLGQGMASALEGLATGTLNFSQAVLALGSTVGQALVKMAAQDLAGEFKKKASSMLGSLLGAGESAAEGVALTSGAAAVSGSAVALTTAGASLVTGAAAISASAASLAAAAGAAGVGSSGGGLGNLVGSMFGLFADGGYTGSGAKYEPAGIVHAGEFVNRQEVVREPGALAFLSDFNRQGMAALLHWRAPGYATGGLVSPLAAPARPSAQNAFSSAPLALPSLKGGDTTLTNSQTFLLVDDPARIAEAAFGTREGEQAMVVALSRNPSKFRKILGL